LNPPLADDISKALLMECLSKVKVKAEEQYADIKSLQILSFKSLRGLGCSGHPDLMEHQQMADELVTFLRELSY
jgi:hypothetical protein